MRYSTYLPPLEQMPSSRLSNIATVSEPECTDKAEEDEDDNASARMSDRHTFPKNMRPFASREEFEATYPIHREVNLFMRKSEAEGAGWRYRRWSRAPCDVRVSPNVPGMPLRERAGTPEAITSDVEEDLVFGDFPNRATVHVKYFRHEGAVRTQALVTVGAGPLRHFPTRMGRFGRLRLETAAGCTEMRCVREFFLNLEQCFRDSGLLSPLAQRPWLASI
jgi:hypothetical protein